jgi:hypothetical protein
VATAKLYFRGRPSEPEKKMADVKLSMQEIQVFFPFPNSILPRAVLALLTVPAERRDRQRHFLEPN